MFDKFENNKKCKEEIDAFKEDFAKLVIKNLKLMNECRYKSIFFSKIEEAVLYGELAISSNVENIDTVQIYGLRGK